MVPQGTRSLQRVRVDFEPVTATPPILAGSLRRALGANSEAVVDGVREITASELPVAGYSLRVDFIPPGLYLADIRLGLRSIYDNPTVHVTAGMTEPIDVVFASDGGSVTGTAGTSDSPARWVTLVPANHRRGNLALYKSTAVAGGRFRIANIAPGEYKLFAWTKLLFGREDQDADFIAAFEQFGQPVLVTAGQMTRAQVETVSDPDE